MSCESVETMNLFFYEGPAGCGKTTALIDKLKNHLLDHPLLDGQYVLGLTMMHGARQRLSEKLKTISELKCGFQCSTFDSFAWRIVSRWRSLYKEISEEEFPEDFDATCNSAAKLLSIDIVRKWVAATHPIILVDEAQDCKKGRLGILQELTKSCVVLVAADAFQDLFDTEQSESVMWLQSVTNSTVLIQNHRTRVDGLLKSARSLREGNGFLGGTNCQVKSVASHSIAVHLVAYFLLNNQARKVAILTPTKPEKSKFISNTIEILRLGGIKLKNVSKPFSPQKIKWETDVTALEQRIKEEIGLPEEPDLIVNEYDLNLTATSAGIQELHQWIRRQRSLRGVGTFTVVEIIKQISAICHHIRAFRSLNINNIRAMTIHQAKNQEFDGVVVLWPYEVGTNAESNRRLLYNAITRAKRSCLILIQDTPKLGRINKPPFVVAR